MTQALQIELAAAERAGRGFELEFIADAAERSWRRELAALERNGGAVSFYQRLEWLRANRQGSHRLISAVDSDGVCHCACAVSLRRVRALPGHRQLQVERFQGGASPAAEAAVLGRLAELAVRTPRLLEARVRLFSLEPGHRRRWARVLAGAGFRLAAPRLYQRTVVVSLQPSEAAILAGFHSTARRHIRAVEKNPTTLRQITDPGLAARMHELIDETRARTGGAFEVERLAGVIGLAQQSPDQVRVVGLFRTDVAGPGALLAFAVGYLHGDHAEYATAASTRRTDLRLPMSYALAWDLMRWAKGQGARWFDFGGITAGRHRDDSDPLGGISDFKRYFSSTAMDIAEEWVLELSRLRTGAAELIRSLRQLGSNLRKPL